MQGSTTTGDIELVYYDSYEATTPTEVLWDSSTANLNTTLITGLYLGKITSSSAWTVYSDSWQVSDTRAALFGGPPTKPPTVTAVTEYDKHAVVILTGTSPAGNPLTYRADNTVVVTQLDANTFVVDRNPTNDLSYAFYAVDSVTGVESDPVTVMVLKAGTASSTPRLVELVKKNGVFV